MEDASPPARSATRPGPPTRLPVLDGVRGVAVLAVMAFHFFADRGGPPGLSPIVRDAASFGTLGVDLFFVLSGFLITRILLHARGRAGYYRAFFARRALRILPLYVGYLALLYVAVPLATGRPAVPLAEQVWFWTTLQGVAMTFGIPSEGPPHFWSLAVEEHFYLVWPVAVRALSPRGVLWASAALVGGGVAARIALLDAGVGVYYLTPARVDALAAGCFLAGLEALGVLGSWRRPMAVAGVVLGAVVAVGWGHAGAEGPAWAQVGRYTVVAGFCACIVGTLATANQTGGMARLVGTRALRLTGTVSYGLYVFHPTVFYQTSRLGLVRDPFALFALCVAATGVVAAASYVAYERPFLALKRYAAYGPPDAVRPDPIHPDPVSLDAVSPGARPAEPGRRWAGPSPR